MDVFNALDLMDNQEFLEELKFGIGDGNLQYYVYNWKCPLMPPNKVNFNLPSKLLLRFISILT
jgi:glycylpeptide N-tetradecanoyltransferase